MSELFGLFVGKVCPVEAPGVLKFREACCVGISRKEVLPLRNPTDRWMECIVQVGTVECHITMTVFWLSEINLNFMYQ